MYRLRGTLWFLMVLMVGLVEGQVSRGIRGGRGKAVTDKPTVNLLLRSDEAEEETYYDYMKYGEEYQTPNEKEEDQEPEVMEQTEEKVKEENDVPGSTEAGNRGDFKQAPAAGAAFGMADDPAAVSAAIESLSQIPGLNMDPKVLALLPASVLNTLLQNLANSGLVEQRGGSVVGPQAPAAQPRPAPIEVCPETDKNGIQHYCRDLADGMYHDPWNPWCGYIECAAGTPKRKVCPRGRWMDTKSRLGKSQKDLCQMALKPLGESQQPCSMWTDMDMCRNAAKVESYGGKDQK